MRISDWSSDVCSSDLDDCDLYGHRPREPRPCRCPQAGLSRSGWLSATDRPDRRGDRRLSVEPDRGGGSRGAAVRQLGRSEEHTSELQSLMRISYAVFCLKKQHTSQHTTSSNIQYQTK